MSLASVQDLPLWVLVAVYASSAVIVFRAGTRLAGQADRFAQITGLSGATVGLVLLGGITSLPEVATSITAAVTDAASLAVNGLIGGAAMQLVFLAVADAAVGRQALTSTVPRPDVIAQSAMNIGFLALVAGIVAAGDRELLGLGVGAGAALLVPTYAVCIWVSHALGQRASWVPAVSRDRETSRPELSERQPMRRLAPAMLTTAGVILVAGFLLARSGDAIGQRTGLGASFFGAVFLAAANSLPELSSALAAARIRRPQLAIGDILGANMFNLTLIFGVDVVYPGGPVLGEVSIFSIVAACLAIILNVVLIIGLVERRDRTIARLGVDSAAILGIYGAGIVLLYHLRPDG